MTAFDPERALAVLNRHGVRYVIVGGMAAVLHGSPLPTEDIDITPDRASVNLDRLASALRELDARIRTSGDPVTFPIDGAFLAAQPHMLNLVTIVGDLDLTFTPAGFPGGFDDLAPGSTTVDLGDAGTVAVAALDDVIASKRAANRPKDLMALPYLETLALEIERDDLS